ncbi:MAG: Efflux ABC transporter, ATP-binding protein [uncultured Thermomicrobiales bacterium]|uniref:Efflux ABC transporter, ATP-binding protein n=1 Tax=uncultured Thermomicrobiales bacterium TaxID=1645740 RepID=A0A6J4U6B9_9BACT|nr:MAG: Efflux ABC transporter, ATP-binding protein [uncultured Thermomicrobiales bacterium]
MAAVIRVEHLQKRYGDTVAVKDISLEVFKGEIFGVLGPNGAGKTTTVECLQGLREPSGGSIRILGVDPIQQRASLQGRIGSQLQESALPDRIKVWEALNLFASQNNSRTNWRHLMDEWGLSEKANTSFANLSGGQRQRLFVALALVNEPEVVFLDELTQGLDPSARRDAWNSIRSIRERGATVVLVTHYMDEVEALCDRLVVVNAGEAVATGSPQDLIARGASQLRVRFTTDALDISWLEDVNHVDRIARDGDRVEVQGSGPVLALVASALVAHGIVPSDLRMLQPSLEDIYFDLIQDARKDIVNANAG